MRHEIEHRRRHRELGADAQQQHQQAERGDRGLRQHLLQVSLLERRNRAPEQRHRPETHQQPGPNARAAQHRRKARQQVNTRLHHGGRMEIGRNRRRRLHGIGQPELERELRALGESRRQHQRQQHRIRGVAGQAPEFADFPAAADALEENGRRQQRESADAGHHQGLHRRPPRRHARGIEADQQERGDRGHFPEHKERHQVVAQHQPLHGAHEHQHEAEEPAPMWMPGKVFSGIDEDECADPGNRQREDEAQPVELEAEPQAMRPTPFQPPIEGAVRHSRHGLPEEDDARHRHQRRDPGRRAPGHPMDRRHQHRHHERRQCHHAQGNVHRLRQSRSPTDSSPSTLRASPHPTRTTARSSKFL